MSTFLYNSAEEAIDLDHFPVEIRKYIKNICIEKYPQCVSLHSLDAGDLSLTLGFTQLKLREGESLPRSKRIFHISPPDARHLEDICELLIRFGYLIKSPVDPNGCHLYGMASYLVPRSKPNSLGRLVVDFSPINSLLESPANVIPEVTATLQFLQGKGMFTSIDLRYAFLALKISKESQPLTTFLTPTGSYQWISLPTGAANSPVHFTNALNKILHYKPVFDVGGNVVYSSPNVVQMEKDPLPLTSNYFDDVINTSYTQATYELTVDSHFDVLEKAVERLAFHNAKINVRKCSFAFTKIYFLGWFISRDFLIADPRRIEKIRQFEFPANKKNMRGFLGLVNSLRRVISIDIVAQLSILTPLTSSKSDYNPTEQQMSAFEHIKRLLVEKPLFSHLIDETAEKILFVDAATSTGVLGGVLAQKKKGVNMSFSVPTELDLENKVHRIIYNKKMPYVPCMLFTKLPVELPKPSLRKTVPPNIHDELPLLVSRRTLLTIPSSTQPYPFWHYMVASPQGLL